MNGKTAGDPHIRTSVVPDDKIKTVSKLERQVLMAHELNHFDGIYDSFLTRNLFQMSLIGALMLNRVLYSLQSYQYLPLALPLVLRESAHLVDPDPAVVVFLAPAPRVQSLAKSSPRPLQAQEV